MAKIPLTIHLGAASQLFPVAAWAMSRARTRPALLIAAGALVSVGADAISLLMSRRMGTNHVMTYLTSPLFAVLLLAALREWQLTRMERRALTAVIFVFLGLSLLLVAFMEDPANFNFVIGPLYSLLLLGWSLWTLVRRAGEFEATPLHQHDWTWESFGLAIYGAATALTSPIGGFLMSRGRPDLVFVTWEIRGVCVTGAMLLVSWGIYRGPMVSKFSTLGQSEGEIV